MSRRQLDRIEKPIARTEHGCIICLRWIQPGERYIRYTGIIVETGDFSSSAYCAGCDLAWRFHCRMLDHDVVDCCYTVECLDDSASVVAAALSEAITNRWWAS